MTPEETREWAVQHAEAVVGLGANPTDEAKRTAYLELIAPGETPSVQSQMATMSGCGLVVAGIWRAMGFSHEEIDPTYKIGKAISRLMSVALQLGCWKGYASGRLPGPGDMVLVGGAAGGVEHVYTVLTCTVDADGAIRLTSVDGGQRDAANQQVILAKQRIWKSGRDYPTSASDPGGNTSAGRGINGWIEITGLADYLPDVEPPPVDETPTTPLQPVRPLHVPPISRLPPRDLPTRPLRPGRPAPTPRPVQPAVTPPVARPIPSPTPIKPTGLWARLQKPTTAAGWSKHWAALRVPAASLVEDQSLRGIDPRLLPGWYLVGVHASDRPVGPDATPDTSASFRPWPNLRKVVPWQSRLVNLTRNVRWLIDPTMPDTTPDPEPPTPWENYRAASGAPEAGQDLPPEVVAPIVLARGTMPPEPNMIHTNAMRGGHMYIGRSDTEHVEYLCSYLNAREVGVDRVERMKVEAFRSLLFREGTTSAINTYDNMIVTWGLGFGGKGLLRRVLERIVDVEAVTRLLSSVGVRYDGDGELSVVDVEAARVVSGKDPALEVIRASVPLLCSLIHLARGPLTRDAVTEAQFEVFAERSAEHDGAEEIATQALFNLITHLKHWAPAYAMGAIPWALTQVSGELSEERDRALAPQIGRYFYGKAQSYSWKPAFSQFKQYVTHMKQDGLDCTSDPWFMQDQPTDLPTFG